MRPDTCELCELALWFAKSKTDAASRYPEFRVWHAMIEPLFGIAPPDWAEPLSDPELDLRFDDAEDETDGEAEEETLR